MYINGGHTNLKSYITKTKTRQNFEYEDIYTKIRVEKNNKRNVKPQKYVW